ncbi:hypothetical protein Pla22_50340 [Rubripirellula amarantea]|uniref:Uncharacterized protein n=1 Tax=Rubripirellula amarantea TaxID=2527999 RepID=A0A5C5WBL5_9BACT|nr:hypothetical protein Pla22_50340 [Rubripirellula amarantea]
MLKISPRQKASSAAKDFLASVFRQSDQLVVRGARFLLLALENNAWCQSGHRAELPLSALVIIPVESSAEYRRTGLMNARRGSVVQ